MRRAAALLLACTVLFAAGCASIFSRADDEEITSTPAPQETVPQRGGDMFIAVPESIVSFSPIEAQNEDLVDFMRLLYESPFRYDETGRLHEYLVDRWEVSEDGRTYTFHVRDGVYFSDGTLLTARDVYDSAVEALNVERSIEPESDPEEESSSPDPEATPTATRRPSTSTYANRFQEYGTNITSIDLDGDSIVIRTSEPGNDILHFMTFPVSKSGAYTGFAPGTGPYTVVEPYEEGEQITLEANPSWWQGTPYIERIVGVPASGQREKIDMQQTSILDLVTTSALNSGNYSIYGKSKVIDYMTNYFDCLVPNLSVPGLSNTEVRRAISNAIDRREILSTVLLNHGVPADFPIAPDSFIMDARFRSNQRDVAAALQLLGNAGYRTEEDGSGRTLSLNLIVADVLDSTYKKEAARAIRKQLGEVFIEVTVEELPEEEFASRLAAGDYDLAYCSYYLSTVPSLSFMLTQNGTGNYNGFSDTQVDQALEDCQIALTEEELVSAYAHLQELLSVHVPVIGLYFRMNSIICDEGIGGITGVREETIYDDIASWYTMYTTRSAGSPSQPTASATQARQTEPEGYVPFSISANTSQATASAADRSD